MTTMKNTIQDYVLGQSDQTAYTMETLLEAEFNCFTPSQYEDLMDFTDTILSDMNVTDDLPIIQRGHIVLHILSKTLQNPRKVS